MTLVASLFTSAQTKNDTTPSHNYSYIWCFSFGLRAVLSFQRWSKYIKNAKFYAESNGRIADF
jgi:hypothetical protein